MIVALIVLTVTHADDRGRVRRRQRRHRQHPARPRRQARLLRRARRAGELPLKVNKNTELWETCPTQATTQVPGAASNVKFAYVPVPANGASACSTTNPVGTMIDFATGSFRMKFTGHGDQRRRGDGGDPDDRRQLPPRLAARLPLVLGLRDPRPEHVRRPGGHQNCAAFLRDGRPSSCGVISWITGDKINGPDVHAGPVLDLRLADLRPARRHGQRAHRGAGAADRAGDDRDLGLQQQRDRQRRPDRERAVHHRAAGQLATCSPTPHRTARSTAAPPTSP